MYLDFLKHLKNMNGFRKIALLSLFSICLTTLLSITSDSSQAALAVGNEDQLLIEESRFGLEIPFLGSNIETFLNTQPGVLKSYQLPYLSSTQSVAQTLTDASLHYRISAKVLLVLIEVQTGLVTNPAPTQNQLDNPFGDSKSKGFLNDVFATSLELGTLGASYVSNPSLVFNDGTKITASSKINPATFAIQAYLARLNNRADWNQKLSGNSKSFYDLYKAWFGDPISKRNPRQAASISNPQFPSLPWPYGSTGLITSRAVRDSGALHDGGGAIDFYSNSGQIAPIADGLIYQAHPDGLNCDQVPSGTDPTPYAKYLLIQYNGTFAGWYGYYYHFSNVYITSGSVTAGTSIIGVQGYTGNTDPCNSNGTHLHIQFVRDGVSYYGNLYRLDLCPPGTVTLNGNNICGTTYPIRITLTNNKNNSGLSDGDIIKGTSTGFYYAYYKGTKFYIPDSATATASGYDLTKIKTLDDTTVASFPTATAPDATSSKPDNRADGTLVAVQNVTGVFAMYGGALFGVPDPNTLTSSYGSDAWSKVIYLPGPMFNTLHTNTNGIILRSPSSGSYYLVQNGQKRLFPNPDTITYYGLSINDAHTMPDPMLNSLPNGDAMPGAGSLDRATCAGISGWTWDPKAPNTSITYHLYKDGQFGVGTFVGAYPADQYRADLVSITKDNAKHGFSIPVPDSLLDGQNHSIYVYAINTVYNQINPLLQGSGITIKCAYGVGQGSNYPSNFIDVFYSGGATDRFGNPTDIVRNWSSSGVKYQPMSGGTATNPRLWHDEGGGSDPANIRAFVTYGPIGDYYLNLGGPSSWLGAPTSNYYTNAGGQTQKSFAGGYLLLNGNTIEPHSWPTTSSAWKTTYYNNPGLMSGPTYVSDEGSANTLDIAHNDWLPDTPIAPSVGLSFNNNWSVKWERNWTFGAGSYKFHLCGDDGIRLYLGGVKVIDQWHWQNLSCYDYYQTYSTSVTLPVKIEYFQLNGSAAMSFSVTQVPELIVTNPVDTGDINAPNTLSWALAAWDTGKVIRFNTNNISVRGSLPPVKKGTQLLGSCSNQVVIDGSYPGAPLDGLSLNGNAYILGVKLQKFKGKLVKLNNSRGNTFVCSSLVQ